jgi:hypothetical protein
MDKYIILTWPDIQYFMDKEGFTENCCLINDDYFITVYGSSAYFVNYSWYLKKSS